MLKKFQITEKDLKEASENHDACLSYLKKATDEISRLKNESDFLKSELEYVEERLRSTVGESKNHPWRG